MTFLGWNVSEYEYLLPSPIQLAIDSTIDEEHLDKTSTSTPTQKNSDDEFYKFIPVEKPKGIEPKKVSIKKQQDKLTPEKTPEQTKTRPTYYPAPTTKVTQIKNEIKNIINEIVPPETPAQATAKREILSTEEKIKKAVVNIFCSRTVGNKIQKITGSGVIIDEKGVIITNAHVAEYFLLAESNNNTDCSIRTGSPAITSYKAKLVYLPTAWVNANKNNLSLATLTGTGQDDYAILVITGRARTDAPNIPLEFLETTDDYPSQNQSVFVAGYPAGFSEVRLLDSALYELTKPTTITRLSSFNGSSADVVNTGPTSVAEHGSSGGGVIDTNGNLIALIAATTIDSKTGLKNIQAITLPYIKQSIRSYSGKSLDSLISNAKSEADNFEKTSLPILVNTLLGN